MDKKGLQIESEPLGGGFDSELLAQRREEPPKSAWQRMCMLLCLV
jgi:hypothetical protein